MLAVSPGYLYHTANYPPQIVTASKLTSSNYPPPQIVTASKLKDVKCGDDGCQTEGVENQACHPIKVPYGDVDFRNKKCIMFVRSQEVLPDDCKLGGCMRMNLSA